MRAGRPERMDWRQSAFGVPGENGNGRRAVELCVERGLCVFNMYVEHNILHKGSKLRWSGGKGQ